METEKLFSELSELTNDLLRSDNKVILKVGGYSMFPCLRPNDQITIKRFNNENYKKGDIIVYRSSEKWIAHRVKKVSERGKKKLFITIGDSCRMKDAPVAEDKVIGKVIACCRNGKQNLYHRRSYEVWLFTYFPFLRFVISTWLWFVFFRIKVSKHISGIYKNLSFLTQTSKNIFRLNLFFALLNGIFPLVIIYLMKWLIDEITKLRNSHLSSYYPSTTIYYIVFFIALILIVQTVLSIEGNLLREKLIQSVSKYVFGKLHEKHASVEMEFLENASNQDKIHRAVREAGMRPNKMIGQYLIIIQSLAAWIIIAVLLFSIHWSVFVLIFFAVIPGFLVRIKHSSELYKFGLNHSQKEREGFYYNRILTSIAFAKELKLFRLEKFFISRFNNIQEDMHNKKNHLVRKMTKSEFFSQIFAVVLIFLSFFYVAFMAINGTVSIGVVILFFLIFQRGYILMKELFRVIAGLIEDNAFLKDLIDFLNLPSPRNNSNRNTIPEFPTKGIKIENVSFKYPSSHRNALQSVSIEIPKGKTIALVGENGSGKTTIIKLICGLYHPQEGRILFNNIDMSKLNIDEIGRMISVVFQDFALYNLTVSENIALGDIEKPLKETNIIKAARQADINDVLEKLPLSYNTMLGNLFEKGEELSMGQWQKMALAKAFYRDSPIVLLDEPSSALDPNTERKLLHNIKTLTQNKTVVIVSHRLSSVKWADIIYVLKQGEVIEIGNHEELMNQKGSYFEMYSGINPE